MKKCAAHAKLRFLQRFNYPLTDEELQEIEELLFSGHGTLVDWAHGEPGVYEMKWREFEFYAVFEYKTFKVVTFLTKDMGFRGATEWVILRLVNSSVAGD